MKIRDFGSCKEVTGQQYALSLYTLAESVRAKDVLEIGAGWGWSSRAFALSLENRQCSRLVSIDKHPARIHRVNRVATKGTGIDWDIIEGDSAKIMPPGEFDLIYIDGNPYMAHADFLRFYPKLRPGGLMVMDGYEGQVGPTEAVDSLAAQYPFVSLPYHPHYSHAIHRKPLTLSKKDGHIATCGHCTTKVACKSWREVDKTARDHAFDAKHRVTVRVEPRDLTYVVIPKGAM
jgi:predicted O-methyltransferase YrrM